MIPKYYMYGAGNNSWGVIKFFGQDNFIKIIDNDERKRGQQLCGIDIVSFKDFIREYNGETVIISLFAKTDEAITLLKKNNIYSYYLAPVMQYGYLTCSEWIERSNLNKNSIVAVYGSNPIAELLINCLEALDFQVKYVIETDQRFVGVFHNRYYVTNLDNIEPVDVIFLAEETIEERIRERLKENARSHISDLDYLIKEDNRRKFHYLEIYKNIHKGERCFLIGNGPSLNIRDLEILRSNGEITFGCNKISLLFDKTVWRPEYYFIAEYIVYRDEYEHLKENEYSVKFVREFFNMGDCPYPEGIHAYKGILGREKYIYPQFSYDMVAGLYGSRTVMYDMIQAAVYMGFREIYLLGVDFSFGEDGQSSHFVDNYTSKFVDMIGLSYRKQTLLAYEKAEIVSREHDFRIYNATHGGNLEIYERVDFDGLFHL